MQISQIPANNRTDFEKDPEGLLRQTESEQFTPKSTDL